MNNPNTLFSPNFLTPRRTLALAVSGTALAATLSGCGGEDTRVFEGDVIGRRIEAGQWYTVQNHYPTGQSKNVCTTTTVRVGKSTVNNRSCSSIPEFATRPEQVWDDEDHYLLLQSRTQEYKDGEPMQGEAEVDLATYNSHPVGSYYKDPDFAAFKS